jgi:hypothetical protein
MSYTPKPDDIVDRMRILKYMAITEPVLMRDLLPSGATGIRQKVDRLKDEGLVQSEHGPSALLYSLTPMGHRLVRQASQEGERAAPRQVVGGGTWGGAQWAYDRTAA